MYTLVKWLIILIRKISENGANEHSILKLVLEPFSNGHLYLIKWNKKKINWNIFCSFLLHIKKYFSQTMETSAKKEPKIVPKDVKVLG